GYIIISANELRLLDAHPCHLSRSGAVDWGALLGLMSAAARQGRDPFLEGVQVQERLFATRPILLGVEESLRHPNVPGGLRTDVERARQVRKRVREMLNSRGEWEPMPPWAPTPLREILTPEPADEAFQNINENPSSSPNSSTVAETSQAEDPKSAARVP